MDPASLLVTTAQRHVMGYTLARIRAEVGAGLLERVIRGWYCRPGAPRDVVKAMRLGGTLGCVSALKLHGAWCPPDTGPHVCFPSHASGRRLARGRVSAPDGTVTHWYPKAEASGSAFVVAPMARCIEDMLVCQPAHVVVVLDSLLHRRLVQRTRLDALILAGPHRMRFLTDHVDGSSESGIESIVRFRLATAGIRAAIQGVFNEQCRLDLEIDGWLVLEIDGRKTHAQEAAFTRDRVRTATIMRDGRVVLQFASATVVYDWDFVLTKVLDVMRQHAPIR